MRKWTDKFDVVVQPGPLPEEVVHARQRFQKANSKNEKVLAPRVVAHLTAYEACLEELSAFHRQIADFSDLDLEGESRQVAAWFVSGRIIGLLNASIALARDGFASEIVPILRTAHEAIQLLRALSMHRDPAILRDWLRGFHIKPARVRSAEDRNQKAIRSDMREAGIDPPSRTRKFMEALYEDLSEMAHVKRSRVLEIASIDSRMMPLDGHPAATIRAYFVYVLGLHVMDAVSAVGIGLGISRGDEVVIRTQETLAQLNELVRNVPIDPDTLRGGQAAA